MQILRGQLLLQLGAAITALAVGVGGAVGAVAFSPWVDPAFDPLAFAGMLLLALMFIPLAWVFGVHKTRHLRRIRRLADEPGGERHRVIDIRVVDGLHWILFQPGSEVVGVPLIHGQDLTHLTDDDGLAEVIGVLGHRETVLLRTTTGEPIWPSSQAGARLSFESLI